MERSIGKFTLYIWLLIIIWANIGYQYQQEKLPSDHLNWMSWNQVTSFQARQIQQILISHNLTYCSHCTLNIRLHSLQRKKSNIFGVQILSAPSQHISTNAMWFTTPQPPGLVKSLLCCSIPPCFSKALLHQKKKKNWPCFLFLQG